MQNSGLSYERSFYAWWGELVGKANQVPGEDERLVSLAGKGDSEAVAELLVRFLPLVKIKAASFKLDGLESDDLAQEGLLGLLNAIYSYKRENGASFATYASACVKNRMISAARSHMARRNLPLNFSLPFDDIVSFGSIADDPQEILAAKEETARLLEIINFKLSGFEKSVLKRYLIGESYEQIAKALGTKAKAVDNALQRIKKKLKSAD